MYLFEHVDSRCGYVSDVLFVHTGILVFVLFMH